VNENSIRVVVTGVSWMGGGIGSIESALEQLIREAEQEIDLTAYSITSGADVLFDWLEAALARGIKVRMIINRKDEQPSGVVDKLERLAGTYQHFELYNFTTEGAALHAKVIIADRRVALIGSSNLSKSGLLNNHEIAVLIRGPVAQTTASVLERIFKNEHTVRVR
jgi:cardiolipin synthase